VDTDPRLRGPRRSPARVGADRDPYIVFDQAFTEGPVTMTAHQSPQIHELLDENVPNTSSGSTLAVMAARDVVTKLDGWTFPRTTE
jgi:peptide/nickel transport system substrate-binding protein